MHGLICKSLEGFVVDQHGTQVWDDIRDRAGLSVDRFEALRVYDDKVMLDVLVAVGERLGRSRLAICEDIGHWICTHPPLEPVRRLIRFTGATFSALLYGLDEFHDRARMAIPGIEVPRFRVLETEPGVFTVSSRWLFAGGSAFLIGILRAMADDYGVLALIEPVGSKRDDRGWNETVEVRVFEQAFQKPRDFALGGAA